MDNRDRLAEADNANDTVPACLGAVVPSDARFAASQQAAVSNTGELDTGFRHSADLDSITSRSRGATAIDRTVVCGLLCVYDWAWVLTAAIISLYLYKLINPDYRFDGILLVLIGLVAAFSCSSLFKALRLYVFAQLPELAWQTKRILAGWAGIALVGLSIGFLTKTSANFSRVWLVTWFALGAFGLLAGRVAVRKLIARWSANDRLLRQVAIVGTGAAARRLLEQSRTSWLADVRIVGIFDDRRTRIPPELDGIGVLGNIDRLVTFARTKAIDEIIIALPCMATDRISELTKRLQQLPVDLRLWIDVNVKKLPIRDIEFRSGVPVAALADRPLKHWSALQKRIEDVALSTVFLLAALPLMLVIALAIRLDSPGPVFFRQKRFGFNNKIIEVLKFRTMFADRGDVTGGAQTQRSDPRVTRVGRFLRQTSLDELPQLFNVLTGSMSIVGPRPHPLSMKAVDRLYHDAVSEYFARHRVRPGITGLAQVGGCRGETDTMEKAEKRIALDLAYIDTWSLALDLKIIGRTFVHLFDDNAY
jgi:polysaccharide biosynthesis protein PslA